MAEVQPIVNGDSTTQKEEHEHEPALNSMASHKADELTNSNGSKSGKKEDEKLQPSGLRTLWGKLGLDIGTVMMMFKGSLPPTIAVAFYQANAVAETYTTLGYLVPIISVLSTCVMPRAKYIQTLILNTIGICIASGISTLGIWSGIRARLHTSSAGSIERYNSSQSAVCAIWLFVNIWFANVMRAKFPQLQLPVIVYSIFANVTFTYGPIFLTMSEAEHFIKLLLKGFLTAFAISTGVSLFIIPVSSRTVVFKEQAGYIMGVRRTIKAITAYIQSLEGSDMFVTSDGATNDKRKHSDEKKSKDSGKQSSHQAETPEAKVLKGVITELTVLHGKLHGDIPFAKRETSWGKLDAKDIDEIFTLLRGIILPLIGMSTITDIFERIAERRGWIKGTVKSQYIETEAWEHAAESEKDEEKRVWNEIMKTLHEPFAVVAQAMDEGMEHAGVTLELLPRPKKKDDDVESVGTEVKPGDPGFAKYLDQKMVDFYVKRGAILKAWAKQNGLSEAQFDAVRKPPADISDITPDDIKHKRDRQQLYLILYLEHLLYSAGTAVAALVRFADKKVEQGVMKRNRLIVPGQRRIKKWILSIGQEDLNPGHESPDSLEAGSHNVYLGAGFDSKKDPEHLPPATAWQRFGNGIRIIPRFLKSDESIFGLRVAFATLTIGIIAFLENTQLFFIEQRLVWAMIIIAIGMSMTSGQSMFGFVGRILGTALSMIFSIIIWYIVDGQTAGVIVMLWFFIFLEMYFFLKFPRFIAIFLICIVTQVLIIGYELQVRKIGIKAASATGQPYYPIYELAPYRLACVAGGSFVAFVWTIFPYPLTDRSWLRKDLGSTLYMLANYYSIIHTTIGARMHNTEGDMKLKSSPGRRLEKMRKKIFNKLLVLLPSLKQHSDWQQWELTIGGKFPKDTYDGIMLRATNIMKYLSLASYATVSWTEDDGSQFPNTKSDARHAWLQDLATLIQHVEPTSHQITSTLSLLSASVRTGSALPPYIQLPKPYQLSQRLEQLDKGILDARHVEEPGYSAYAVMQVASSMITDDLERLIDHVKDLVGETDFSFQVSISDSSVDSAVSESGSAKGKKD